MANITESDSTDTFISGVSVHYSDDGYVYVDDIDLAIGYELSQSTFSYSTTGAPVYANSDVEFASLEAEVDSVYQGDDIDLLAEADAEYVFMEISWGQNKVSTAVVIFLGDDLYFFQLDGDEIKIDSPSDWVAFDESVTLIRPATGDFAPGEDIAWAEIDDAYTRSIFTGTKKDDVFETTPYFDIIFGEDGNDLFINQAGGDHYDGGEGASDFVTFENDPSGVLADLSYSRATDGYGEWNNLTDIEVLGGSAFADELIGDENANVFYGLGGFDRISGGDGIDDVRYDRDELFKGVSGVEVTLQDGYAFDGFGDQDSLTSIENVYGTAFDDIITGAADANVLQGGHGDDTLNGLNGKDTLLGGKGQDTIEGGKSGDHIEGNGGGDVLFGGKGNDRIWGGNGNDRMNGASGSDTLHGEAGDDTLAGGKSDDMLNGGDGDDDLDGGQGTDVLNGDAGNDELNGGGNADVLDGGTGNDTLLGGNGADLLNGSKGKDILRGGGGGDTFVFADKFGRDVIEDFNTGRDGEVIDLALVSDIISYADLTKNHLAEDADGDAVITDTDGNTITLLGVSFSDLSEDDFLF